MIKATMKVIHETPDKKLVIIDGRSYPREVVENWTPDELAGGVVSTILTLAWITKCCLERKLSGNEFDHY